MIRTTDDIGGVVEFDYDPEGRMVTTRTVGTILAGGVPGVITTTVTYDLMGRKLSMSDPDKGDWTYTYNRFGRA